MGRKYRYRYVATSEAGFVQQIVRCVAKGYRYYTVGRVRRGKAPEQVDQVLLTKFGIERSPSARARAKQRGEANIQYLRYGDLWVMMATKGKHHWKEEHTDNTGKPEYHDFRNKALEVGNYAISSRLDGQNQAKYRVRVVLNRAAYKELRALYLDRAKHWSVQNLGEALRRDVRQLLPYRPIRVQLIELIRQMNKVRKPKGYERIPYKELEVASVVYSVSVFEEQEAA